MKNQNNEGIYPWEQITGFGYPWKLVRRAGKNQEDGIILDIEGLTGGTACLLEKDVCEMYWTFGGGWKECSEALPTKAGQYITGYDNHVQTNEWFVDEEHENKGFFKHPADAWIPLPKLPYEMEWGFNR